MVYRRRTTFKWHKLLFFLSYVQTMRKSETKKRHYLPIMIDLEELRLALRTMKPRTKLFDVVKSELQKQGRWKYLKRGRHVPKDSL